MGRQDLMGMGKYNTTQVHCRPFQANPLDKRMKGCSLSHFLALLQQQREEYIDLCSKLF